MLLVHGVLRDADRTAVGRVSTRELPVRPVTEGALAAVVSEAPDRDLTGDDAVTHLDVLVALVAEVPVLPLAFGTAVPDEDAVRTDVLGPDAQALESRLAAVADLVELRLDLVFDTDACVAAVTARDSEVRRLAQRSRAPGAGLPDRMALGEVVAARVAEYQEALAEAWTAELVEIAERLAVLHVDEQSRRTAYLVRRGRLAESDAAVGRLRTEAVGRADAEYVGPLPVYSFLDEVDADPAEAHTSRWGW